MKRQTLSFIDFSFTVDKGNYEQGRHELQGGKKTKPNPFVKGDATKQRKAEVK